MIAPQNMPRMLVWLSLYPKGPFRTKNAIAMEIVVFYYRGSNLLSVPIRCHFFQEKTASKLLSR